MKKLILIGGILFICSIQMLPQDGGDGSSGSPYYGTVSTDTDWYPDTYTGGTIYVSNLTIGSGATLSIRCGIYYGGIVEFSSGGSLTIGTGCTVIINPGTGMTVDNIYNSGTLILESASNEPAAASLLHSTYQDYGVGVTQVKQFLIGGQTPGGEYKWHYVATPIANVNVSTYNTLNLAQYIESLVTGPDNYPGWVAYDGYQYSSGSTLANTFSVLTIGHGYDYYSSGDATLTYTGAINTGDIVVPVTSGTGYPDYQGYNLIGNPFASCLDWDDLINNNPPASIDDAIYFTLNGSIASYVGGIGDNGGNGTIPPLQGFFVKATANSSITLRADARLHNIDQLRYKKKSTASENGSTDSISFVRFKMLGNNDSTDLVIRFNSLATSGFDRKFDAHEFSRTSGEINIWSTSGNTDYSINGLPFPENQIQIPVGINTKLNGTFRLFSSEINKLDNYSVVLKDIYTSQDYDLRSGEYAEFTGIPGSVTDRYVIVITKSATSVDDLSVDHRRFAIYPSTGNVINIRAIDDAFVNIEGSIAVYDLAGRKVYQDDSVEWNGSNDLKQVFLDPGKSGIMIVEVSAGGLKYVKKIPLK
jgi:hypothetical protein